MEIGGEENCTVLYCFSCRTGKYGLFFFGGWGGERKIGGRGGGGE